MAPLADGSNLGGYGNSSLAFDDDNEPANTNYDPDYDEQAADFGHKSTQKSRMAGEKIRDLRIDLNAAKESGDKEQIANLRGKMTKQRDHIYGDGEGAIADSFDISSGGAGSKKNTARISGRDLKELAKRYGMEKAVQYVRGQEGNENIKTGGAKLQQKLAKYEQKLCLLYTSPSPRDRTRSRMPSSA